MTEAGTSASADDDTTVPSTEPKPIMRGVVDGTTGITSVQVVGTYGLNFTSRSCVAIPSCNFSCASPAGQSPSQQPHHETRKRRRREGSENPLRNAFPPSSSGVDSSERAQRIARKLKELERVLQDMEDASEGDLNVNCFARDSLHGKVYTISPRGLSTDVARAMESNYQLEDLFDLEVQQAKKRRVIRERLAVTDTAVPKFTDAFPHVEHLRTLVERIMLDAAIPIGEESGGLTYSKCGGLSSKSSLRDRLCKAVRAAWYPEDVPFEEPSGLPREHLESIVKGALRNGAITAQKLADIAQRELGFDIRASMMCLELFESFEGPGTTTTSGSTAAAAHAPSVGA